MKFSKNYQEMLGVYRQQTDRCENGEWDFSPKAAEDCFRWESHGGEIPKDNGYAFGKKSLGITVAAWKEDLLSPFPWMLSLTELRKNYSDKILRKLLGDSVYDKADARTR